MKASKWAYYPEVDMLRGIAALSVLISHAPLILGYESIFARIIGLPQLGLGVDLFFCISGFMTTQALRRSRARYSGIRSELAFFVSRCARLIPAAWLVAFVMSFGVVLRNGPTIEDVTAALSFTANVHWARCWDGISNNCGNPYWLSHYWSLGTEALFYLCVPFLALLSVRSLQWLVISAVVLCLVLPRPWGGAMWVFRPEAFLFGVILARIGPRNSVRQWIKTLPRLTGIETITWLLICGLSVRFLDLIYSSLGIFVAALMSAFLLTRALEIQSSTSWFDRACCFVGKCSFGVYLLHPAILGLSSWLFFDALGFAPTLALSACLCVLFAWGLSKNFELPMRKRTWLVCENLLQFRAKRGGT